MRKSIISIIYLSLLFTFIVASSPHEEIQVIDGELYMQTPFGLMLKECVHGVPSGTHVVENQDGSLSLTNEKANFQKTILKNNKCIEKSPEKKLGKWVDNGGYYLPQGQTLQKFEGNYRVPNNPARAGNQFLYYFLGTQNNDGSGLGVTILQPVLTYHSGWYFSSWNCCPQGQSIYANPVYGISPYDTVFGSIEVVDKKATITSRNKVGQQSVLSVAQANRNFNWIDATLEVYYLYYCSNYPTDYLEYQNMKVTLANGEVVQPKWTNDYGKSECNGNINIVDPSTIRIQHNLPSLEEN